MRLEATMLTDVLYLFGQENFIFLKSGKSQGILKHYACENHSKDTSSLRLLSVNKAVN